MNFGSAPVVSGNKKPEVPAKKVTEKDTKGKTAGPATKVKAEVEEKVPAKEVKGKAMKEETKATSKVRCSLIRSQRITLIITDKSYTSNTSNNSTQSFYPIDLAEVKETYNHLR